MPVQDRVESIDTKPGTNTDHPGEINAFNTSIIPPIDQKQLPSLKYLAGWFS
jgi:hypothetical protein